MAQDIIPLTTLALQAKELFKKEFCEDAKITVFAPGRVNLIGEHTDYNDGFVMPMALPLVTVIVGNKMEGDKCIIVTTDEHFGKENKVEIEYNCVSRCGPKWALYCKGVLANFRGGDFSGFKALIHSTVPVGGGLSSSAAIEVATYMFLDQLACPNNVSDVDKALACQKAEHDYAGMPCGIMDQFISVMGKKDHALLIDCRELSSTLIPLTDPNVVVLITNSNVKHELTGSEYPTRKKQCQEAATALNKPSLREAAVEDVDKLKSLGTNDEIIKRARHVITEIKRTVDAGEALKQTDYKKFGELMNQSHISLRDDYDVSCQELDSLVEIALSVDGVLGSRMTGAGFGGCTVTLVKSSAVNCVIETIKKKYQGTATFYICKPSDGAGIVKCDCKS